MLGTLSIVATPIGNLGDMTLRALETLKSVDFILCEDTRNTQKLLNHFEIKVPSMSYHQHSDYKRMQEIEQLLKNGKNFALVTDAGTPGISDPGNLLLEHLSKSIPEIKILAVPGPSAVIAALSISGFPTDNFLFLGFPPHKNKRQKFFQTVADSVYTTVFYESNHRIAKALLSLAQILDPQRQVCICRELTKSFESTYRGTIQEILEQKIPEKGEFVVIISEKL